MKNLNVAVIGAGSMGKNHARVYSDIDGAELVAISSAMLCTTSANASTASAETRFAPAFNSILATGAFGMMLVLRVTIVFTLSLIKYKGKDCL